MKSFLLFCCFTTCYVTAWGQVPVPASVPGVPQIVNDPTSYKHLIDGINQARKQVNLLKEAKEVLTKVNSAIREAAMIQQIIDNQIYVTKQVSSTMKELRESKVFTAGELAKMTTELSLLVTSTRQTLALAERLLQEGIFKMGDYERMDFLRSLNEEMEEASAVAWGLRSTYQSAMKIRVVKKTFEPNN